MPGYTCIPTTLLILTLLQIMNFQNGKLIHVESIPISTKITKQQLDITSSSNIAVQAQLTSTDLLASRTPNLGKLQNQSEMVEGYLRCGTILKPTNNSYNEEIIVPPRQGDQKQVSEIDEYVTRIQEEPEPIPITESPMLDPDIENSTNTTSDPTKAQIESLNGSDPSPVNITINKWENRVIFFIDPCFIVKERMMIENAIWMIQQELKGCLEFGIYNSTQLPSGDYIAVEKSNISCWSDAFGKVGGEQKISLQPPQCMGTTVILHELAHALGIPHEQQRPDRDQYVTINWSNIKDDYMDDFKMEPGIQTFGIPYNIKSEMQYSSSAWSKNGKPTIVQKYNLTTLYHTMASYKYRIGTILFQALLVLLYFQQDTFIECTTKKVSKPTPMNGSDMRQPAEMDVRQLEEMFIKQSEENLTCHEEAHDRLPHGRSGVYEEEKRWKGWFCLYIDPSYNEDERKLINYAHNRLWQVLKPCLNFCIFKPNATPTGDYVHVYKGDGCFSNIGRWGGKQNMSLESPGCMRMRTIVHEMIHALGFWHEHNRPDRDDFVRIYWKNIKEGRAHNFEKYEDTLTFDVPYDVQSIMHYGSYDFNSNKQPTIVEKDRSLIIKTDELSPSDKMKLKKMYKCPL
ncbi:unnamed protein product [Orchesella dallaii]|uniref:Metalloendopeptidase n=1 Tax=Orchesella dallaii TaxID=48710 RepID=A0ABP1PVZ2_9HEXA